MCRLLTGLSDVKSLSFIPTLVLISFLTIGGCSENNGGGDVDAPAPQTSCTTVSSPCGNTTQNQDGTVIECTLLTSECAVDLEQVITQTAKFTTKTISNDTIMWIEAWGGQGGGSDKGGAAGASGYAVTTWTVNDIKGINGGSSIIYYFLGSKGIDADERCGGGGGVGTIVTTEDLVLNPTSNPTQTTPPILLVAGAGGGAPAGNKKGTCATTTRYRGGNGGSAIATMLTDGQGAGGSSSDNMGNTSGTGGNKNGNGKGGAADSTSDGQSNGADGFGGQGGVGGRGPGCSGPGANNFINTQLELSITNGQGGNGGGKTGSCAAGGGAGGGGYGGGGGGQNGNEFQSVTGGSGGGSFAIQSTQTSGLSPTATQSNPCGGIGCVRISFAP